MKMENKIVLSQYCIAVGAVSIHTSVITGDAGEAEWYQAWINDGRCSNR